jgi:hypothetical protein
MKVYDLRPHNITRLQHVIGVFDRDPLLRSENNITVMYEGLPDLRIPSIIVTMGHRDPE